ncbi:uncharacterized protein LOC128683576 [Plodia interpunctella]|uniref:uncharacterized protein LOC128683576 n=1 Tax=Plodia interpunctella TaxID=58824 RepID=UPI002367FFE0|nr:uncharacterized protein LOC128683576 [Plodia interpunctella]
MYKLMLVICFEMYFTTRTVLRLLIKKEDMTDFIYICKTLSKCMLMLRHVLVYLLLGVLGQWATERFRQVTSLADTIHDMDLGEQLTLQTWQMGRLAAVCVGKLQTTAFSIDGQLPLKTASTVISTVILIMQFGISLE